MNTQAKIDYLVIVNLERLTTGTASSNSNDLTLLVYLFRREHDMLDHFR